MSILILILPFWIIGILIGWYVPTIFEIHPGFVVPLWLLFLGLSILPSRKIKRVFPTGVLIIILLVCQTSFLVTYLESGGNEIKADENIEIVGGVVEVKEGPNSDRLSIRVLKWYDKYEEYDSNEIILLLAGKKYKGSIKSGDIIRVKVKLEVISKKAKSEDFPERLYWAGEGIRKKGWIKTARIVSRDDKKIRLKKRSKSIQDKLCILINDSSLGANEASILKAMILGQKDDLPQEIKDVFRISGISHLLAVSGLHVGLVYLIIVKMLFFFKGRKTKMIAEIVAILAVWTYAFITGFGPSVQRAAGMISLFALSRLMGRSVKPMQILALSFLIQTYLDPFALFSFGFQLSYLAVAGIFLVYPQWRGLLKSSKPAFRKVWDFSGVSISAQTFTFPFVLIYFQEFPSYFLLGNLLLVPIGLVVFYLGVIYIPILALGINFNLPSWLLDKAIGIMLSLGEYMVGFPHSVVKFQAFSLIHVICYFLIVVILFAKDKISTYKKVILIVLCLLGLSLMNILPVI